MLGVALIVISVVLSFAVGMYVYYSTLRKEVDVPTVLFEDSRVVVSGQDVLIESIPKKYLTVRNHRVPKGTLMAYLEVVSKETGNTWKYYLKYDQECHIEVPGTVQLSFKGSSIKEVNYPERSK